MGCKKNRVGFVPVFMWFVIMSFLVIVLTVPAPAFGAAAKTKLSIAHYWPNEGHFQWGLENAIKGFQKRYPDIEVKILPSYNMEKCIVEISGGVPQDVIFVDGPVVSSWALRGLLQPLDSFIKKSGVSSKDFVPPAWRQCVWDDKVWAMTIEVDPNFALIWNKDLFEEAAVNPDVGPKILRDFETLFMKLTRYDSSGKLKQIAMVPWEVYGNANTMYTWGWIFGGDFYDYEKNKATAHDQANVEALEYLRNFYLRYNVELAPLNQGLPARAYSNRFTGGRQAMTFCVTGDLRSYIEFFPELRIGIGQMFSKTGENPAWVGGWTIAMPVGVKNPEAAWKLIHYLTADPEGTALFGEASGWLPGYLPSPVFREKFAKDRYMSVYMQILLGLRHQRPVIPVQQTYWNELEAALPKVFAGQVQPREALQHVSERVDAELKKVLAEAAAKKK